MSPIEFKEDSALNYARVVYDAGRSYPDIVSNVPLLAFTDLHSANSWLAELHIGLLALLAQAPLNPAYVGEDTQEINVVVQYQSKLGPYELSRLKIDYSRAQWALREKLDGVLTTKGLNVIDSVVEFYTELTTLVLLKRAK